jgi:hypothetical protein
MNPKKTRRSLLAQISMLTYAFGYKHQQSSNHVLRISANLFNETYYQNRLTTLSCALQNRNRSLHLDESCMPPPKRSNAYIHSSKIRRRSDEDADRNEHASRVSFNYLRSGREDAGRTPGDRSLRLSSLLFFSQRRWEESRQNQRASHACNEKSRRTHPCASGQLCRSVQKNFPSAPPKCLKPCR